MFTNLFINYYKKINLSNIDLKSLNELNEIIEYKFKLIHDSYFIIHNGKKLKKISNIENNDILEIITKKKGGIGFFLGQIASITAVIAVLSVLIKPLIDIIKILVMIISVTGQILSLFPKVIESILLLFNPKKFIDDVIFAITYGIKSVVGGMMSSMDSGTKSNKEEEEEPNSGPKVCMPPSIFNLIVLVLCPPLAIMLNSKDVFMGIVRSLICAILTVWCYYFPGLIFAAIHILC